MRQQVGSGATVVETGNDGMPHVRASRVENVEGKTSTHLINVSRSPVVCHIRCVLSRRSFATRARVAGIWSLHDHSSLLVLRVEARDAAALPPRPRRGLGAGAGASSSPDALTFSAAVTNQCRRKAYISRGILCAMYVCWSSWSTSRRAASTSAV